MVFVCVGGCVCVGVCELVCGVCVVCVCVCLSVVWLQYLIVDSLCIELYIYCYAVSRACHCCCRLLKSCGKHIFRVRNK